MFGKEEVGTNQDWYTSVGLEYLWEGRGYLEKMRTDLEWLKRSV